MTQNIPLGRLLPNTGQIEGLPANPRLIHDEKFEQLKRSLVEDPEMLELRELLVYSYGRKYIVIGGNMRYRAAAKLGIKALPCKIIPKETSVEKLRAITIKDNIPYGQWDFDILSMEWSAEELQGFGMDLPYSGDIVVPDEFFMDTSKKEKEGKSIVCPHCNKEITL